MLKAFVIDYIRAILEFELKKNRGNTDYFDDYDIKLFSFYEHLTEGKEVDRYVEYYKQLTAQQTKLNNIGFGIVSTSDNPTFTNIRDTIVCPFEWSTTIRVQMLNRDKLMDTIYKAILRLKGRKVDVAELNNGKLVPLETVAPSIPNYAFIGTIQGTNPTSEINAIISDTKYSSTYSLEYVYVQIGDILKLYHKENNLWVDKSQVDYNSDGTKDEINVPTHTSFTKYKVSFSVDDIRMDQPYTLDGSKYCELTFGGSATLCNNNVLLGNDLLKINVRKNKIVIGDNSYFTFTNQNGYDLEPLDIPSSSDSNQIQNQLRSNFFKSNSHTDNVSISLKYSFLYDTSIQLLKDWFDYARYGDSKLNSGVLQQSSMTPNIIYDIKEYWASWGNLDIKTFKAKIVDTISVENTESDVITLELNMQLQGDNN